MKIIRQFSIIMVISFLGEILNYVIPFTIPAGIYGLVLLFAGLCFNIIKLEQVERAGDFLIEIIPFFLVPAGVGLMTNWLDLKSMLVPFLISVVFITILVLAFTGLVSQHLIRLQRRKEEQKENE